MTLHAVEDTAAASPIGGQVARARAAMDTLKGASQERIDDAVTGDAQQPQPEPIVIRRELALVRGQRLPLLLELRTERRDRGLELASLSQVALDVLVDRRVQEEGEHGGRRTVDGHGH